MSATTSLSQTPSTLTGVAVAASSALSAANIAAPTASEGMDATIAPQAVASVTSYTSMTNITPDELARVRSTISQARAPEAEVTGLFGGLSIIAQRPNKSSVCDVVPTDADSSSSTSYGLFDIYQKFQEGIEKAKQNPEDVTTRDYAYLKSLQSRMEEIVVKWSKMLDQMYDRNSSESPVRRHIPILKQVLEEFRDRFMHCPVMHYFERWDHDQAIELAHRVGSCFDKQGFLVCYFGEDLGNSWIKDIITIAETGRPINATGHRPLMHFRLPGTGAQFAPTSNGFLTQNIHDFTDHEPPYRAALHSHDIIASNNDYLENASYYFRMNSSALTTSSYRSDFVKDLVQHYLPGHPALREKMQRKILETWVQFKRTLPTKSAGRFYVDAIPKGIYLDPEKNFVIRTHRHGVPCAAARLFEGKDLAKYLKPDKNGNVKSCKCDDDYNPQVRLLEPGWALHRKNVVSYAFDSMNFSERALYETMVNPLGMAIHELSRYRNALFFARLALCQRILRQSVNMEKRN